MKVEHTLLETIEQKMAELINLIKGSGSAPSNVSTEPVQAEPGTSVVSNASQTEMALPLPLEVMPYSVLSFEVEQGGDLEISKPTAEQSRVFEEVFGLSPDTLDEAGLRRICYTPEEGENLGQYSDGEFIEFFDALPDKATYDTPAHQWEEFSFGYLPSIPCGESFRFPIHTKSGEKVGYTYHRIIEGYGWGGRPTHEIVTYQGYKAKRQATFLPRNARLLADPNVPLVFTDNPFQALNVHQNGGAVISLNGSMRHGFSAQGHFAPFGIEEVRQRVWTPEDASALFEMLCFDQIPFNSTKWSHAGGREVIILCELGWLRKEYLEMAVPLLQQVIALHNHLQGWGAKSRVLTAPINGPENWQDEVKLDQMLGTGKWDMDDLTVDNGWPGFHSAK